MGSVEKSARSEFQKKLGDYLKNKRIEANVSQKDVAKEVGLESAQFVSNIERGMCGIPTPMLRHLIKKYKINKTDFLEYLSALKMDYYRKCLFAPDKMSTPRKKR